MSERRITRVRLGHVIAVRVGHGGWEVESGPAAAAAPQPVESTAE
ncbi:hypothetical protein AB0B92_04295 [Streptomyces hygroscopicus]